jgi:hypothetical protein
MLRFHLPLLANGWCFISIKNRVTPDIKDKDKVQGGTRQDGARSKAGSEITRQGKVNTRQDDRKTRQTPNNDHDKKRDQARQGKARQGKARQGKARQGKARQGKARQGKVR